MESTIVSATGARTQAQSLCPLGAERVRLRRRLFRAFRAQRPATVPRRLLTKPERARRRTPLALLVWTTCKHRRARADDDCFARRKRAFGFARPSRSNVVHWGRIRRVDRNACSAHAKEQYASVRNLRLVFCRTPMVQQISEFNHPLGPKRVDDLTSFVDEGLIT